MQHQLSSTFPERQGNELHPRRQGIRLAGFSASPILTNETAKTEENFLGYSPDFKVLKSLAGKPTP